MASIREQVIVAVQALWATALPAADVDRNRAKPQSVAAAGTVNVRDGDPGEPEIDLSPVAYNYSHGIPADVAAYASATETAETRLDAMLAAFGSAVQADRTLGGLCQYIDVQVATLDDLDVPGGVTGRWAEVIVTADYSTSSPL